MTPASGLGFSSDQSSVPGKVDAHQAEAAAHGKAQPHGSYGARSQAVMGRRLPEPCHGRYQSDMER